MLRIQNNPSLEGMSVFVPDVVFSKSGKEELKMDLILPQFAPVDREMRFPLVVFIQGSAWHFPDINAEIPQLSQISRAGYVVATVTHRNIDDGYPAPAFLEDVKTAIRFLRSHAEDYRIDPDRVCAFGTSSGGNTALLLGLTGDMEEFKTGEYPEYSDSVQAVIDCFGPTDLITLIPEDSEKWTEENKTLYLNFCGGSLNREILEKMSPINYVREGKSYVPFLIAHGSSDSLVDFSQSETMVKRLEECGADVSFVCVDGADHEGDFWSDQIWDIFLGFLDKQAYPD